MIKYCCDLCEVEIKDESQGYSGNLPIWSKKEIKGGKMNATLMNVASLEKSEILLCRNCAIDIANHYEILKKKFKSKKV